MKQSRRALDQFQDQLQGKLNQINQRKSNKKLKIKSPLTYQQQYIEELDQHYKNDKNNLDNQNYMRVLKQNLKSSPNEKIKSVSKSSVEKSENSTENNNKINQNSVFSTISNKQLQNFMVKNFDPNESLIDLSYLLAKVLASYSGQTDLSQQQIKQIFLELQTQITTTDSNIVSINALQLAVKKKGDSLKLYINDKVSKARLKLQSNKIKQKQRNLQKYIYDNQQTLKNKLKQLQEKQKNLAERQKNIIKKQKAYNNKQKQLLQRIKNGKKMLEERAQKLSEQHSNLIQQNCQKVQKKMQTYERNMKYKIQNMNHKINEMQRLRQYKQSEVKNHAIRQIEQNYEKLYSGKYKKYQMQFRQLQGKLQQCKKQTKQLQQQNSSLMKACSKIQAKLGKQQKKKKQVLLELQNKNIELKEYKSMVQLKHKQNEQLMNKLYKMNQGIQKNVQNNQKHKKQQSIHENDKQINKESQLSISKSKKSLPTKKKMSENKTNNNILLQISQIVYIFQLSLQNYENKFHQQITTDFNFLNKMLILSTKLFINQIQCKHLINLIYNQLINSIQCIEKYENHQQNNQRILSLFIQLQSYYPTQMAQIFYKYYSQNKQNNLQKYKNVWKLIIIYSICSIQSQSFAWLKCIIELLEDTQIQNQMIKDINNNNDNNFVFAICTKWLNSPKFCNLKVFDLCSQLLLTLKLVGQPKYSHFWQIIGKTFIKNYITIIKDILIKTNKSPTIQQQQLQQIQRISILIQRLIVGYKINITSQYCQYFDKLRRKCKGSLLQKNLNSILEQYDAQSQSILKQLDDI